MVQPVTPHLDEVDASRAQISPLLLVLGFLVLAIASFLLVRANTTSGPSANTPAAIGGQPTSVPVLSVSPVRGTPTIGVTKYKVQSGDTLTGIAAKFGISVSVLMTANSLKSDIIRPGVELIIPLVPPR